VRDDPPRATVDPARIDAIKDRTYRPFRTYADNVDRTTQPDVNPGYILPDMFLMRLQKLMDEYVGGVTAQFTTSRPLLERGLG
jgi:adenylylsulfate reductase subunit A